MNPLKRLRFFLILIVHTGILSILCNAQESKEELAKASQNPLANLMSFPFQNNTSFGLGPYDRNQNVLNFQPVLPFFKGKLITRTIIPIITQPDIQSESVSTTGLGDINFTAFYSSSLKGLLWGIGPVVGFPTASNSNLGSKEWTLGPSLVLLSMPGKWVLGCIANNAWSIGNSNVNSFLFQYFVNYNLKDGAYLTSAPILTANWNASPDDKWTVPFGLGAGKIVKVGGKIPLNLQAGAYYNVIKPENGGDWSLRVMAVVLLPTSILKKK